MKSHQKLIYLILLAPLALFFTGCGAGFPIMTAEQEELVQNVDRLVKENKELKNRVSMLEGGGTSGAGSGGIRTTVADATNAVEEMRRELSFIRGTLEDGENERAQLDSDLKATNDSLKRLEERLASLEEAEGRAGVGGADAPGRAELKNAITANQEKIAALEAALASMGKTVEAQAPKPVPARQGPEEMYFSGYRLLKEMETDKAADLFKDFLQIYPKHKLADHARYWLGEIYYSKGDWERAILEFDRVIKEYPKGDKVPAATLKEGFSFLKLGAPKEARLLLQRVIDKYPESLEASIAKTRLEEIKGE
ncbi:MAG: tol-pal system protein YbgF [Thermodesulfobacteriota bacterium]